MALPLSRVRRLHRPWNIQRECYRLWRRLLKEIKDYFYPGAKDVLKTCQGEELSQECKEASLGTWSLLPKVPRPQVAGMRLGLRSLTGLFWKSDHWELQSAFFIWKRRFCCLWTNLSSVSRWGHTNAEEVTVLTSPRKLSWPLAPRSLACSGKMLPFSRSVMSNSCNPMELYTSDTFPPWPVNTLPFLGVALNRNEHSIVVYHTHPRYDELISPSEPNLCREKCFSCSGNKFCVFPWSSLYMSLDILVWTN